MHWNIDADDSAGAVAQQLKQIAAEKAVDRVLIDSRIGTETGGTGVSFDWDSASATLANFADTSPGLKLIVAGGLRPDNVADAILRLNPWGIDVASGVEEKPGKKSREKLTAFINAARNSDTKGDPTT